MEHGTWEALDTCACDECWDFLIRAERPRGNSRPAHGLARRAQFRCPCRDCVNAWNAARRRREAVLDLEKAAIAGPFTRRRRPQRSVVARTDRSDLTAHQQQAIQAARLAEKVVRRRKPR